MVGLVAGLRGSQGATAGKARAGETNGVLESIAGGGGGCSDSKIEEAQPKKNKKNTRVGFVGPIPGTPRPEVLTARAVWWVLFCQHRGNCESVAFLTPGPAGSFITGTSDTPPRYSPPSPVGSARPASSDSVGYRSTASASALVETPTAL